MNKKINIGIIGAGKIVESIYLSVLLNIPVLHVQWIFHKDEKHSVLLSEMYGVRRIDTDGVDQSLNDDSGHVVCAKDPE